MRVSHITGHSRPLGEVGLTPRQYTEWNVVGRACATGGSSQQGLLPEVYCTACTRWYAHQSIQINNEPTTKNKEAQVLCPGGIYSWWHSASSANGSKSHDYAPVTWAYRVLCPALVVIYSWWHSVSSANGDRSHDCAPVMWAYGIPCPAMVSPNASQHKEDKLLYPDHYLVWYAEVDSGPHTGEERWVGVNSIGGGVNLLFGHFFLKNCMKMKEIEQNCFIFRQ